MEKADIVKTLGEMASLLELAEANPFEIMAFRNGAENLDDWDGKLGEVIEQGALTEIHGIGKGLAGVIEDLYLNDRSAKYDELCTVLPRTLLEVLRVPGLGPKKVKLLYNELGVGSLDELERAVREQRIRALPGFSAKTEERLLSGIERARRYLAK